MTALTTKQTTKINAALAIIHKQGHNVGALQQQAKNLMAQGQHPARAYEATFNGFLRSNAGLAPTLHRITSLIEASDGATVDKYASALRTYIETGDETAVNALEPVRRADSIALAMRNGEVSAQDVAEGRMDWGGMGFEQPAPGNASGAPAAAQETAPAPSQKFEFKSGQAQPGKAGHVEDAYSIYSQPESGYAAMKANTPAFVPGVTGYRSPATEAKWNNVLVPVVGQASPYAGKSPAQIKVAMAAQAAIKTGWQRDDSAE